MKYHLIKSYYLYFNHFNFQEIYLFVLSNENVFKFKQNMYKRIGI
jgi:hypothetical protein